MKTLYCHALQSYIWNRLTSRRIREHGKELVVGDIVGVKVANKKVEKEEKLEGEKDNEVKDVANNKEEEVDQAVAADDAV